MSMPLSEWDQTIAPVLRTIQFSADGIAMRAQWITEDASDLVARPAYLTKAEDALEKAIKALEDANATLIRAMDLLYKAEQTLKNKPVGD